MLKYVLPFCLVLVACDTYVEEQRSVDFEPIYLENSEEEVAQEDFGASIKKIRVTFSRWRRVLTE